MTEARMTVDVLRLPEVKELAKDLAEQASKRASLEAEVFALKVCIENGRAAHNEDRAARDWLARENDRLRKALGRIAEPGSEGVTTIAREALAFRSIGGKP
jgi:hypothetical protein